MNHSVDHLQQETAGFVGRRTFLAATGAVGALSFLSPSTAFGATAKLGLEELEARISGRIGLCAEAAGRRVGWRFDERFPYCSTFKLFLAACALARAERGTEKLDRPVPILKSDMVSHAPVSGPAVGATLTIEQLCKAIVEVSDNAAANILIREIGGLDAWRAWYRSIGDNVTRVDRLETELNTAIPGDPRDTSTPAQFVANLESLLKRGLLSPTSLALLERWLVDSPTGPDRIKAGVPHNYRVGHKTGTGPKGTHNDIGIIRSPAGPTINLAVFCTQAVDASPRDVDQALADATRLVLRELGHS
jgi:beta-lactamase class A